MRTFTVVPSFEGASAFFELPDIGFQGDHLSFAILFNLTELTEHWPNILPAMIITNPHGETFIAPNTEWDSETHIFTWYISSTETTFEGTVLCQLKCTAADDPNTVVCMSRICQTKVYASLAAAEDPPESFQNWLDTLAQLGAEIQADAASVVNSVEITETNARAAQESAADAELAKNAVIAARNSVEQTAQIAVNAQNAASQAQQRAQQAAANAESAMTAASQAQSRAEHALEEADIAVVTANAAATSASDSATQTAISMNQSILAKNAAEAARDAAVNAKDLAVIAQNRAEDAESGAQTAQGAARNSASAAATSETNAAASETAAANSASAAATSETNAAASETSAANSASAAQTAKTAAEAARDRAESARDTSETAAQTLLSIKGSANGLAELDSAGKVPSSQLPSYVDDVLEFNSLSVFPVEGEDGKIYVAKDTGFTYRWSGSQYIRLSSYELATQTVSGLMSAEDKFKLDGIAPGATANIVENTLSSTSETSALSAAQGKILSEGKKNVQTPVSSPLASGTAIEFISDVSQNDQGVISPVKKSVRIFAGATASENGSAGLVPQPLAGDQNKVLGSDGTWALPGVVTINGRSPNPVTGDIVIIEGGGSSSYGSYRLDATIAPSDWVQNDDTYIVQISDQHITQNMDGHAVWLEDPTVVLGPTWFVSSTGLLTISTSVQPTSQWVLHVSLAVNGADVLADVSTLQTNVSQVRTDLGVPASASNITGSDAFSKLDSLHTTLQDLTDQVGTIPSGETVEGQITSLSTTKVDTAGTGLAKSGTTLSLDESGVTAGSYGPSEDVTGSNNSTMSVPYITIDAYGRVTSIANKSYTAKDTTYSLPLAANGTRGGVQIGYSASGKNYPVALSGEKMYVNVPWTDANTWRPIVNNLTSTSTTDSLSAAQGKSLNDKINTSQYKIVAKSINTQGATDGFANSEDYNLTCFVAKSGGSGNPTSSGSWFIMQAGSGNFGWQLALQADSNKLYTRRKYTGNWEAWVEH